MKRRLALARIGMVTWAPMLGVFSGSAQAALDAAGVVALQTGWRELLAAGVDVVQPTPTLAIAKDEWRKRLSRGAYDVLFEEDTERPFSSALNEEKHAGIFVCAACNLPLFSSAMKYNSGTGWPSFFTSIPNHLETKTDYALIWPRTEYHCAKCGGHQGHVFDDGPPPTRQRWCNNGLALRFIPKT